MYTLTVIISHLIVAYISCARVTHFPSAFHYGYVIPCQHKQLCKVQPLHDILFCKDRCVHEKILKAARTYTTQCMHTTIITIVYTINLLIECTSY